MINPQRNSLGDRNVEQAIIAIKRGSYLLKYGSRGKPKFCPFRLSTDETRLIWYHGKEKNLQLSHVSTIIPGQRTATFQRYPRPDKEYQSFSLIYDGKHSLDLICKDKNEAEIWCIALRALISRDNCEKWRSEKRSHSASSDSSTALTQQSPQSILSSSSSSNIVNEDQRKVTFCNKGCFIAKDSGISIGRLFTWGNGNEGQLGHGDEASRLVPCCITMLDGTNFCQVACGHSITVALTTSGQVYTMGSSDYGQLGIPDSTGKLPSCVHGKIKNSFIEKIACGSFHVAVLSSQSEVYTWGKGGNGQLGHGENYDRSTPTRVEALKDRCIKSVVCGKNFTAVTCLHKEVSIADYSIICSGCSRPFNFRRKCHNCYNCGLVFCNTCTSKKSLKASLAPSMHKPYRVCEDCFAKLNKGLDVALSTLPPKALASHKSFSEQKDKEPVHTKPKSLLSRLLSFDSFRWPETWHSKKNQKQDSSFSRTPNGSPQFDRSCVSSPASMRDYSDKTPILIPGTPNHSVSGSPVSIKPNHSHSFSVPCNFSLVGSPQVLSNARDTSEDLTKELSILREQVETLTSRSHFLEVELKTTLKQLMEAHEVARVETRKNIAAKEVIRCLVTQLKDLAARLPHDTSSCRNSDPFIDDTLNTLCVSPWWSKLSN
ncbi:PH, RCC1 and FYVE domains-containing protein 1-like [Ipomoea triloba]|uniref:PH, RCC1 and FYVE domains-containing protein 1-like n=1 Tax=Ipomoea triloba TaxID=35885 RepID=UPI00125E3B0B|nr:PH, RCC1 and FYVE domains-containing protein 1-like [Ipomoea triloba]